MTDKNTSAGDTDVNVSDFTIPDTCESTKGAKILIVDDTPQNLQVLGTVLDKEGCRVSFATDGEQALNLVKKANPDLILLDIMMPGIDGMTVCKRLKEDEETASIPVIFLTAKTESDDVVAGFEIGAVDYITKPFKAIELMARVRTQLRLQRSIKMEIQAQQLSTVAQLAMTIAHEFNNPLAIMQGAVDLADMKKEDSDLQALQHDKVRSQIKRMKLLVDKMLALRELKEIDYAEGVKILDLHGVSPPEQEENAEKA